MSLDQHHLLIYNDPEDNDKGFIFDDDDDDDQGLLDE